MLFRRVILMFRGLYAVQGWYLLFRMAIICKQAGSCIGCEAFLKVKIGQDRST